MNEIECSQSFYNTPEEAFSDGFSVWVIYTKGDYALEIFQYFGGQHPGGEYLNKPGAEIHNGFLKEY